VSLPGTSIFFSRNALGNLRYLVYLGIAHGLPHSNFCRYYSIGCDGHIMRLN
jgi:hypothetical protein